MVFAGVFTYENSEPTLHQFAEQPAGAAPAETLCGIPLADTTTSAPDPAPSPMVGSCTPCLVAQARRQGTQRQ